MRALMFFFQIVCDLDSSFSSCFFLVAPLSLQCNSKRCCKPLLGTPFNYENRSKWTRDK
jgi:hypothetical protein